MDQVPASLPSRITVGYILRTAFSGRDNASVDIGRVLWAASAVLFGLFEVHSVIFLKTPFDAMQFAQSSGMILLGGGAALGAKAHCEPDRREDVADK